MNEQALILMGIAAAMFVAAGIILNRQLRRDAMLTARMRSVQRTVGIETVVAPADASQSALLRIVARVGEAITRGGLLSANMLEDLESRLNAAGFRGRNMLATFIGAKLLAFVGMPLLSWLLSGNAGLSFSLRLVAIAGGGFIGLLLPDYVMQLLRRCHLAAVERGLPDALDMMVICTEAGLGLEPAIDRVGREIAHAHPAVSEELLNVAREMRVNADRRVALMNMADRTMLPSLRRLAVTLVQTLQYGTPLSQALRTLSTEMRQEALTRFEARAGRLPALLTVPMIVFILPCVFMIVGGPAIVHVMQELFR
jgi:tight adherence protein C